MKKLFVLMLVLLIAGIISSQVNANVLFWSDYRTQTGALELGLQKLGIGYTSALNEADFVTRVGDGGWDMVIFNNQDAVNDSAANAFANWISGGGKGIASDWLSSHSNMKSAMGVSYTYNNNEPLVYGTVHPIWNGLPANIALTNTVYGIFSTGLDGSVVAATFGSGEAAIVVGNGGRSIMNGFLDDTYDSSTQLDRTNLAVNEINFVLNRQPQAVPEPATLLGFGIPMLMVGLGKLRQLRK